MTIQAIVYKYLRSTLQRNRIAHINVCAVELDLAAGTQRNSRAEQAGDQ
jgi:hypothetical protein